MLVFLQDYFVAVSKEIEIFVFFGPDNLLSSVGNLVNFYLAKPLLAFPHI